MIPNNVFYGNKILNHASHSVVKFSLLKSGRIPKPLCFQTLTFLEYRLAFYGTSFNLGLSDIFDCMTFTPLCLGFLCYKMSVKIVLTALP